MIAALGEPHDAAAPKRERPRPHGITRLRRPVTRVITVEGVPLVVTLTEKTIEARVYRRRRRYSVSIGGLFMSAVREAKRRAKDELLPQEEMDMRVPRPA